MMRPTMAVVALATVAFSASPTPAAKPADPLPRKPFLGIQLLPAPGGAGVAIGNVIPGGTGASLGIRTGDRLTSMNGSAVATPEAVIARTRQMNSGEPVVLELVRAGKPVTLRGRVQPKPLETFRGATVDYGSVQFRDGRLRDVLVLPEGVAAPPVVYFIQGYSCGPVEGGPPDGLYRRLGEELVARGIGFYRVEKIGQGDSIGSLSCQDVDFATELDGFRAAYRHLMAARNVPAERIFMLGHSLGGMQAPLLAAETAPRGIAVYGTVVRNWADYHRDLDSTQPFLISGGDPADVARVAEQRRDLIRMFYFDKMNPSAIVAARPEFGAPLRELFGWDGANAIFGRSYAFAQQLAALALLDAWKNSRTNVLSVYGGSDMVALTDVDHRYLADAVNYWRPGTARYVEIVDTEHGMSLVGSREAIRQRNRSGGQPLSGPFNPKIVEELSNWIKATMAKPPVAA